MITAGGQIDGQPLLVLGLTTENLQRLVAGQPIDVPREALDAVGYQGKRVMIIYGRTEQDLVAELKRSQLAGG